jgi:hypothetical protein
LALAGHVAAGNCILELAQQEE